MARRLLIVAVLIAVPGALVALTALVICRLALGPRRTAELSARLEARGIPIPFFRPLPSPNDDDDTLDGTLGIDDVGEVEEDQPAFSHSS